MLRPEPSLGPRADNVIIPHDLTQLFCPGFTLASVPPSGFTTDVVGCWGGGEPCGEPAISLHSHWSSGLPVCFPSQGTQVQNPWGDICETGIILIVLLYLLLCLLPHTNFFFSCYCPFKDEQRTACIHRKREYCKTESSRGNGQQKNFLSFRRLKLSKVIVFISTTDQ